MTALDSLYQMIYTEMNGASVWGARVFPDMAPADTARPYAIFFYSGGGENLVTPSAQNARLVVTVKTVADTMSEAFTGAAAIETLLRNQGLHESAGIAAVGGWQVLTSTQDRVVHLVEMYQGAAPIYHEGHQYVFEMETT